MSFKQVLYKLKLPIILLAVLLLPLFFGQYVPVQIKSIFYATSFSIKSVLLFALPFIIFSFLFSCLVSLRSGVLLFVILLVALVYLSNFTAIMLGYGAGSAILNLLPVAVTGSAGNTVVLEPAWVFTLPKLVPNEMALISGFITGIFFSLRRNKVAEKIAGILNKYANYFLMKIFIPLLPIFILGFVFKLEHEDILGHALKFYGPIFLIIIGLQWSYLIFLYLLAANFSLKKFYTYIKNVLPASLTGLSTISSMATLPVLIVSTTKNLRDPVMAETIVPATINNHTLGSATALTILSLATMLNFNMPLPSLHVFVLFACYYAFAKFATAAVPGGGVIIIMPLLEQYFGFTGDMVGLLTAIYVLFDPFGTVTNVTANGAFPIIFTRVYNFFRNRFIPNGMNDMQEQI